MAKKSDSVARMSAMIAADGTSIMMPIGKSGLCATPSASSSARSSRPRGLTPRTRLADERLPLPQLLHAGDDRKHDLDLSERRGAEQRPQLRPEHVAMLH